MARRRTVDRFDGRILGAGTSSGARLVVGDWTSSPLGVFADVMVATADDRRVLLAPTDAVADYVTSSPTWSGPGAAATSATWPTWFPTHASASAPRPRARA